MSSVALASCSKVVDLPETIIFDSALLPEEGDVTDRKAANIWVVSSQ